MTTLISLVGANKDDTAAVRDAVFPDDKYTSSGKKQYHWYTSTSRDSEASSNGDATRMMRLKHANSEGSSMETDSLPGYDDLYPDGGGANIRQTFENLPTRAPSEDQDDAPRTSRSYSESPRLQRLKAMDDGHPWSSSLPTPSSSYTSTESWVSQTRQHSCSIASTYDVYEVPWDKDKGLLWALSPNVPTMYIVVVNLDAFNTGQDAQGNYLDMVRAVHGMMKCKGLPHTVYLIGRSHNQSKNVEEVYKKTMRMITEELDRPDCQLKEIGLFVNNMSTEKYNEFVTRFYDQIMSNMTTCVQNTEPGLSLELFRACALLSSQTQHSGIIRTDIVAVLQKSNVIFDESTLAELESLNIIAKIPHISSKQKCSVNASSIKNIRFTCSLNLPYSNEDPFKQNKSYMKDTPVIRYKFENKQLPVYIFVHIFIHLIRIYNWQPTIFRDEYQVFQNCACFKFKLQSGRASRSKVVLSTDKSHLYVGVAYYDNNELFESLCRTRNEIECSIRDVLSIMCGSLGDIELSCQVRCTKAKHGIYDAEGWIDVDELQAMQESSDKGTCEQCDEIHDIVPSKLLSVWFQDKDDEMSIVNDTESSRNQAVESQESLTHRLSDKVLLSVSNCFGRGWQQFFVENDVEQVIIDRAREYYAIQGIVQQVHMCMCEWRALLDRKGQQLTSQMLIEKLQKSKSVMVDIEKVKRLLAEEEV